MTTERRTYTEEFKQEAVRLMESSGKAIAEVARDPARRGGKYRT